jgi:hypothetical protein
VNLGVRVIAFSRKRFDFMNEITCRRCNTRLPLAEVTGGWCETCGSKLPPAVVARASVPWKAAENTTCGGIFVSPEVIGEMAGSRVVISVPRSRITRVDLSYGFVSQHPLIQFCFALCLIVVGLGPLPFLVQWFKHGGVAWDYQFLILLAAGVGAWMACDALKRGYLLVVRGKGLRRKLEFWKGTRREELEVFLNILRDMGYPVEWKKREERDIHRI